LALQHQVFHTKNLPTLWPKRYDLDISYSKEGLGLGQQHDICLDVTFLFHINKYKINKDKYYSDVIVDEHSLNDVERDGDYNIFNKI
jgi:hypothetical protein